MLKLQVWNELRQQLLHEGGDEAAFLGVADEAALEEDSRAFDGAEHREAGALDAAVDGARRSVGVPDDGRLSLFDGV